MKTEREALIEAVMDLSYRGKQLPVGYAGAIVDVVLGVQQERWFDRVDHDLAVTPCTTADCEEPGTVPGVYDDGDCHERVVYCAGCAADLARGGEFVPDRT